MCMKTVYMQVLIIVCLMLCFSGCDMLKQEESTKGENKFLIKDGEEISLSDVTLQVIVTAIEENNFSVIIVENGNHYEAVLILEDDSVLRSLASNIDHNSDAVSINDIKIDTELLIHFNDSGQIVGIQIDQ